MKSIFFTFIISISFLTAFASPKHDSIPFLENVYEEAVAIADESYKPILFYFYSDYCYECIPLDSILQQERLTEYFTLNYVNVKVDFNEPMGIRLSKKFNVNSLPSLAFINQDNLLVSLISDDFSFDNILNHARWTTNPASRGIEFKQALDIKKRILNWEQVDSIFEFTVVNNMVIEKENATTLYYQTQLHKTLNDGLAEEHAEKYLQTQKNWGSEKNMRFIYDNISDTRSEAFQYMINNRLAFNSQFGEAAIDSLIATVVHRRLFQLQEPPQYEEAKTLMSFISPEKTDMRTYEYLIDMSRKTKRVVQYLYLERRYIKKFAPKDHERMIRMIKTYLNEIPESYNVDYYLEIAKTANKLSPKNVEYLVTLSRLYTKKGDKCGALETAVRAYALALEEQQQPGKILDLILEINKMHDDHQG